MTSSLAYTFSNLLGTVYRQGNLVFSSDGTMLYSAVGNRVSGFDLVRSKSFTFPFEARRNISRLALSPDGAILLAHGQIVEKVHCAASPESFRYSKAGLK